MKKMKNNYKFLILSLILVLFSVNSLQAQTNVQKEKASEKEKKYSSRSHKKAEESF